MGANGLGQQLPGAIREFYEKLSEADNSIVNVSGGRFRLLAQGFEYPGGATPAFVRFLFSLEAVEPVFVDHVMSVGHAVTPATLSFSLDLGRSTEENLERLHDFVSRQSSSILRERAFPGNLVQGHVDSVSGLAVVLASISSLSALLVLCFALSEVTPLVLLAGIFALVSAVLSGVVMFRRIRARPLSRARRIKYRIKVREAALAFFSPWRRIDSLRRPLRTVQSFLDREEDWPLTVESLESLGDLGGWPPDPGPQALYRVGSYIRTVTDVLSDHPGRRSVLRELIGKMTRKLPSDERLARNLIGLAHSFNFPGWAVECLPDLFIVVKRREGWAVILAWYPVVEYLKTRNWAGSWKIVRPLCNGVVYEVQVSPEICEVVEETIAPMFENIRVEFPYGSDSAMAGCILDTLSLLEREDQRKGLREEAARIAALRKEILKTHRLGFSPVSEAA